MSRETAGTKCKTLIFVLVILLIILLLPRIGLHGDNDHACLAFLQRRQLASH